MTQIPPRSNHDMTAWPLRRALALVAAGLLLHGAAGAQTGAQPTAADSAASGPSRSIVGGIFDQAAEAGRTVGSEARKIGGAVAQGAREAASAASATAKQAWGGAKEGAQRVGSAASAAARELKGSAKPASQAPAPVESRSTTR